MRAVKELRRRLWNAWLVFIQPDLLTSLWRESAQHEFTRMRLRQLCLDEHNKYLRMKELVEVMEAEDLHYVPYKTLKELKYQARRDGLYNGHAKFDYSSHGRKKTPATKQLDENIRAYKLRRKSRELSMSRVAVK